MAIKMAETEVNSSWTTAQVTVQLIKLSNYTPLTTDAYTSRLQIKPLQDLINKTTNAVELDKLLGELAPLLLAEQELVEQTREAKQGTAFLIEHKGASDAVTSWHGKY